MPSRSDPPLIAVDWGSTHFRAKLVVGGEATASAASPDGIRHLGGRDCGGVLAEHCAAWKKTHPDARVLVSGMAGAREGWREVPYVSAPCGVEAVADAAVSVPSATFGEVFLVPGVRRDDPVAGSVDVMRGEESQAAGLLPTLPQEGAVLCLPGTHSKWIVCREGRIETFRTWMTGEAYDRLTRESLVGGDGTPAAPDSLAFRLGCDASSAPGGLLHQLFLARTGMLAGRLRPDEVRSFVSGLLVGHELVEARRFASGLPIHLVGDSAAVAATAAGMKHLGLSFRRESGDAHLLGLLAIARRRGWMAGKG